MRLGHGCTKPPKFSKKHLIREPQTIAEARFRTGNAKKGFILLGSSNAAATIGSHRHRRNDATAAVGSARLMGKRDKPTITGPAQSITLAKRRFMDGGTPSPAPLPSPPPPTHTHTHALFAPPQPFWPGAYFFRPVVHLCRTFWSHAQPRYIFDLCRATPCSLLPRMYPDYSR